MYNLRLNDFLLLYNNKTHIVISIFIMYNTVKNAYTLIIIISKL